MIHGRKRGTKPSYPICVWNGIFDHSERIGIAIWEFLWLIDAITEEQDGIGWVFAKSPFNIQKIVDDLRSARRTVERNVACLRAGGYITVRKARYGIVVGVLNSRKIRPRRNLPDTPKMAELDSRHAKNGGTDMPKMAELGNLSLMTKQVDSSKGPAAASPMWIGLGISPLVARGFAPEFRELCEGLYATRGSQTLNDLLGLCMDIWQERGGKIPAPFAKAAAEFREELKKKRKAHCDRPELEELPWASK